jgi:hypothetical protein
VESVVLGGDAGGDVVTAPQARPGLSTLGALRVLDREAWVARVTDAMREAGGRRADAAALLGVSSRQLARWLAEPDLEDVPRVPRGYHGHRPPTATCDRCGATPCTCAPIPREWPPWCERCGQPHLDDCS